MGLENHKGSAWRGRSPPRHRTPLWFSLRLPVKHDAEYLQVVRLSSNVLTLFSLFVPHDPSARTTFAILNTCSSHFEALIKDALSATVQHASQPLLLAFIVIECLLRDLERSNTSLCKDFTGAHRSLGLGKYLVQEPGKQSDPDITDMPLLLTSLAKEVADERTNTARMSQLVSFVSSEANRILQAGSEDLMVDMRNLLRLMEHRCENINLRTGYVRESIQAMNQKVKPSFTPVQYVSISMGVHRSTQRSNNALMSSIVATPPTYAS